MSLLDTLKALFTGRRAGEGTAEGEARPDPHAETNDRLSRIAQRGRTGAAAAPPAAPAPVDMVPPPGHDDFQPPAQDSWAEPAVEVPPAPEQSYAPPEPEPYGAAPEPPREYALEPAYEPEPYQPSEAPAESFVPAEPTFVEGTLELGPTNEAPFTPASDEMAQPPLYETPGSPEMPPLPGELHSAADIPAEFLPQEPVPPLETLAPPPVDDVPVPFSEEPTEPEPEPWTPQSTLAPDLDEVMPTGRPGRRSSSIGLTPMGGGEDDEEDEGEEEEGPVFGEVDDEEEARSGLSLHDYEDEEEEEEEDADLISGEPYVPAGAEPVAAEGGRSAVLFRQIFPPRYDGSLSYFGGVPIASPEFAWPRGENGVPLSFLMQVDCAEVPAHARMGLPGRGQLYVFLDLSWGQQDAFRVIHEAPGSELTEIAPPDDLPAAFGEESKHVWKWPREAAHLPNLLPKWPFQPVAIEIPADTWGGVDAEEGEARLLWPGGDRVGELLLAAQGEEIGPDWFTIKDFAGEGGTLVRPFGNFPHDARAIQIVSGLLLERLQGSMRGQIRVPEEQAASDEERAALLDRIAAEAKEWYDDASLEAPFIEVPQEFSDQFWQWLEGFGWLARYVMVDGVTMSIEASLAAGPEAAARIPGEVAKRVRHRHALAVRTDTGLHANIPDRMLAPPVDVQGNQYERAQSHILLLEISSNEGLGHHFGEGVCQFWILPEDLAAGRFDKIELTADAY